MSHQEAARQAKILKKEMKRLEKAQSTPGGMEKLQRWNAREEKMHNFLDWYSESIARVVITIIAACLLLMTPIVLRLIL